LSPQVIYTDDEDSSSDLGNLSVYGNLAPDNVFINEEEENDGHIDGDDDNDAIEENVSEFTMYTVHMFLLHARKVAINVYWFQNCVAGY
jgi:hypothetical protein